MEFTSTKTRLPEKGQYVLLLNKDRYWNTPEGIPDMNVAAVGYLNDFGGLYWSVFGERARDLEAFTHWLPIPSPPIEDQP